MEKIEVYIRPSSIFAFHQVMMDAGVEGVTMWETKGTGRQLDEDLDRKMFRGSELKEEYISRIRIETVVKEDIKQKVIHALQERGKKGDLGTIKIFVTPVLEFYSL